jgi:hypothetical protein
MLVCCSLPWSGGVSPVLVVMSRFELHLNIKLLCRLAELSFFFFYVSVSHSLPHCLQHNPLTTYRNMPNLVECLWSYIIPSVSHYSLLAKLMFNLLVCSY